MPVVSSLRPLFEQPSHYTQLGMVSQIGFTPFFSCLRSVLRKQEKNHVVY
jgi:hypothetical protein